MEGYLNFTLAQSPMENWGDQNKTMCRYQAFRDDSGKYTMVHWQILALKLAFVICFEVTILRVFISDTFVKDYTTTILNKNVDFLFLIFNNFHFNILDKICFTNHSSIIFI